MTIATVETTIQSIQSGRLYQFDRSANVVWRYTSADRKISHLAQDWLPQPISDNGVRMTGEASADTLEIVVPASLPVAQLFRATPPSEEVFVTIYDYDAGEQDADVCWVGSVSAARFDGPGQATLSCDSLSASMRREGLRLSYERSCPHSVYDGQCGVDKAQHALVCTVSALTGTGVTLSAPVPPLAPYQYGACEWDADGTTEMRGIDTVSGTTVQLIGGTYGLAVGMTVTLYPSCDGLRSTCNDFFGNLLNHGGFPHMPGDSIFGKRLW